MEFSLLDDLTTSFNKFVALRQVKVACVTSTDAVHFRVNFPDQLNPRQCDFKY